jgi:hypothetical protein
VRGSDITDLRFLLAMRDVRLGARVYSETVSRWDLASALDSVPERVLLSKASKVIKRGLVTGCACGCRGDFALTEKGIALLVEHGGDVQL